MTVETIVADVCVIGAGAAGLSVAAGAAQFGARTVLIEAGRMGGDCLNTGCVPSKALLAVAARAQAVREAHRFGIAAGPPLIDFAAAMAHVDRAIAAIAPTDTADRFRALGVTVLAGSARFVGRTTLAVDDTWRVEAKYVVIATGAAPAIPRIPGLDAVPWMTSETIWANRTCPRHLVILGAGPIGIEMAQAHRRLGAEVTVIDAGRALAREDAELAAVLLARLRGEGVTLHEGQAVVAATRVGEGIALDLADGRRVEGSHLLVAAGRRPSLAGLGLEAAGIAHGDGGITVDDRLRTTNPRVFALGDVTGGLQFTHVAGHQAGVVLRNMLFRLPARYRPERMPRVTYGDPELAYVGLGEAEARARHGTIRILRSGFGENDRARAEGDPDGLVKLIADRRGRLLGAGIVGPGAGDLLAPYVLAVERGMKLGALAAGVLPYPTRSEAGKRAAGAFFLPMLFSERAKRVVRFLLRWS